MQSIRQGQKSCKTTVVMHIATVVMCCHGHAFCYEQILCVAYGHFAVRSGRDWENCLVKTRREVILMNIGIIRQTTHQRDLIDVTGQSLESKPSTCGAESPACCLELSQGWQQVPPWGGKTLPWQWLQLRNLFRMHTSKGAHCKVSGLKQVLMFPFAGCF